MTEPTDGRKISDMIKSIMAQQDRELEALIAGCMNLYQRAMRSRLTAAWQPEDVVHLFSICAAYLVVAEDNRTQKQLQGETPGETLPMFGAPPRRVT